MMDGTLPDMPIGLFRYVNTTSVAVFLCMAAMMLYGRYNRKPERGISQTKERVLVVGGSSGIGRSIAHIYSSRGAKVCIVSRRADALGEVKTECIALRKKTIGFEEGSSIITLTADFTNAQEMIEVREVLVQAWNGVDTVVVSAGVSALKPLLEVAGVHRQGESITVDNVQKTIDVSNLAIRGNFTGPLVTAVTLIPLLEESSISPSMLLISSLAALVPAPTRSLYGSTKAASLLLYQSLAVEHPKITFTSAIPSTVDGNFRASAVDGGTVREADPDKHGLKKEYVAKKCISAVDSKQRTIFMPYWFCRLGHAFYWLIPGVTEYFARKKYNF